VRDAIHDFNERGLQALTAGSSRPKRTRRAVFDEHSAERFCGSCSTAPRGSFWQGQESLDTRDGSTGCLRGGPHTKAGLGRNHQGYSLARLLEVRSGNEPNAGSPPLILYTKEKKATRPTDERGRAEPGHLGGVGFEDECWWSLGWLCLP
jgi:hypothetical protein